MSKFWRHFRTNGRGTLACGVLGLTGHVMPLSRKQTGRFELIQTRGMEVWDVEPGGPADQAGLEDQDIILSLADQPMTDRRVLKQVLKQFPKGVPLAIVPLRDGRLLERWVVPGDNRDPARRSR